MPTLGRPVPQAQVSRWPARYPPGMADALLRPTPEGYDVTLGPAPTEPGYREAGGTQRDLSITFRSGKRGAGVFLLLFSLAWWSFLGFWYTSATAVGAPWIFFVFPLLHVAAGLAMLHQALVSLFNRTRVTLSGGVLTVRQGPVPAGGNTRLAASSVVQLFVRRVKKRGKNRSSTVTYDVAAVADGNRTVPFLTGVEDHAAARFLELTIEEALGLPDTPVLGEAR